MVAPLNAWLGGLFDRRNIDRTVTELVASQADSGGKAYTTAREAMKHRLDTAEARLGRLRGAIEAGVDPVALVESINEAQAQRAAARAELDAAPVNRDVLFEAEVHAMVDLLGDIGEALNRASAERARKLYEKLRLQAVYHPEAKMVDVTIRPLGGVVRVSEGDLNPSLVSYIGLHRGTSELPLSCVFTGGGGAPRTSKYIQVRRRQYQREYHGALTARGPPRRVELPKPPKQKGGPRMRSNPHPRALISRMTDPKHTLTTRS